MSQDENNNDLGAMISQFMSDPQNMQQLSNLASSLGLGAPPSPQPQQQNQPQMQQPNQSQQNQPPFDLSSLMSMMQNGIGQQNAQQNSPPNTALPFDVNSIIKIQRMMQQAMQNNPGVDLLRSMRPLLSERRAKKVDDAIRIMQLIQALPLIRESGLLGSLGNGGGGR